MVGWCRCRGRRRASGRDLDAVVSLAAERARRCHGRQHHNGGHAARGGAPAQTPPPDACRDRRQRGVGGGRVHVVETVEGIHGVPPSVRAARSVARPRDACDLTVPVAHPSASAVSRSLRSMTYRSTTTSRWRAGSDASARVRSIRRVSKSLTATGAVTVWRSTRFRRRHRSIARFALTLAAHAGGLVCDCKRRHRMHRGCTPPGRCLRLPRGHPAVETPHDTRPGEVRGRPR